MNWTGRWSTFAFLLSAVILFLRGTAAAQLCAADVFLPTTMQDGDQAPTDTVLDTYAGIFRDSNPQAGSRCNNAAAANLKAKLIDTFAKQPHQDMLGRQVGAFQGWLEGSYVTYIFPTALRLNQEGLLTDPQLQQQLLNVATAMNNLASRANGLVTDLSTPPLDGGCGVIPGLNNTCMDDYSVAAAGFAWAAAYASLTNNFTLRDQLVNATHVMIDKSFDTTRSICIAPKGVTTPGQYALDPAAPERGPCTGVALHSSAPNLQDPNNPAVTLSINHIHQTPAYGYGLMTSISSAIAGLSFAGDHYPFSDAEKAIALGLLAEAESVTNPSNLTFTDTCIDSIQVFGPDLSFLNGSFQINGGGHCADAGYMPAMYSLSKFYADPNVIGASNTGLLPLGFESGLFPLRCNPTQHFGLGREVYYGALGWDAKDGLLNGNAGDLGFINGCVPFRHRAVAHSVPSTIGGSSYNFSVLDPSPDVEPPASYQLNGTLPPGISFSTTSGTLSGSAIPSPGIYDFTVTAVYPDNGNISQEYVLPVCQSNSGPPNLLLNASTNFPFDTGALDTNPLQLFTYGWVSGDRPPGAEVDPIHGNVRGTTTTPGTYNMGVQVRRATSPTVAVSACPSGTDTIFRVQISVGCGASCQQNEGYNDGLNADNVWGWAWNSSAPNTPIQVDIYDSPNDTVPAGSPRLATVIANLPRQDLIDAGKGNGFHAFTFTLPDALKDGNTHRIHVTFAGTTQELTWSPRLLPPSGGRFVGVHATNSCDQINGYALDHWQSSTPIDVDIFDNGQYLATVVANYDSSVVPATGGNGTHGFLYYTPDRLKDGNLHQITITFKLNGQQLSGTNQTLACSPAPPPSGPSWEGWFDNVTCDRVDGWAWDANRPNSPIDVAMFADGVRVATLTANYLGQDLLNAGKGNGVHRYLYYLPDFLKDGASHHVTAQIIGQNTDLPISSGITNGSVSCAALPAPTRPPLQPVANTFPGGGSVASSGQAIGNTPAIDVTFSSVSVAGVTTFVPMEPATLPPLPDGYVYPYAPINPLLFDISSTAAYSAPMSLAFTVLGEGDPNEFSMLRILHLEGGAWQDRTSSFSGFGARQVFANAASLSPFVIARLAQRPTASSVGLTSSGTSVYGNTVVFTARVYGLYGGAIPTGPITFFDGAHLLTTVLLDPAGQASWSTSALSAGTHSISAVYVGDGIFPSNTGSMLETVNPASLAVFSSSASRQYGAANPSFTGTISGLLNGDSIIPLFGSAATAASPVGTYAITTAGFSDPAGKLGNYTVAVQNGVLTVTTAPLSVSVNNASRLYGDANPVFTGTITGLLNGDNITASYQSSATAASVVGTYAITATLSDPGGRLGNYSVTQGSGTLTVQAAPLQVTANNKSKMYGDPIPVLDGTVTGIRNADNIVAQYSTTATAQSLVGTYPIAITLSDPNSKLGNYTATLSNGTLTVTRSNITLAAPTFNPPSGNYPPGTAIAITDPTSSAAAIHYTTNGATPTASSPLYTGPIVLNTTNFFQIQAMATQPEYLDSSVGSASYSSVLSVSATPASQTLVNCGSVTYSVSIFPPSVAVGTLTFSVSGLPAGTTASFSPATVTNSGSSTLTVTTSTATPPGTYTLTISAGNAAISGSKPVTLVVQDFNFSLAPSSQAVTAGGGASYSLSGTIMNGFAGNVSLSISGLPAGSSGTFSPTSYTGAGVSTLSVTTSTSTPVGTYSLTVTGTNACRVHTFPITLVVNAPPPTGPTINSLSVSAGPVGTAVTITGVNFGATQGSSTVTFNGTVAPPAAWSAGSISVAVPRGAKTGNVVVSAGGQVSNGVAFTVQDDAVHIFGTNCATCGWQTTDFTIQTAPVYGYTIRSGDILYFYQWQNTSSVAGIEVCFPGGDDVSCVDSTTVDQDGKPVYADTITGVTHFRRVDLSSSAGQTLSQLSFHSHGTTKAGRWDVYFSNVQIVSADGSVHSIFVSGSTPSLFVSTSYGVTGVGWAVEHNHVW